MLCYVLAVCVKTVEEEQNCATKWDGNETELRERATSTQMASRSAAAAVEITQLTISSTLHSGSSFSML